ncbi:hypothetical protein V8D89_006708 [Ganoderma adspersum]
MSQENRPPKRSRTAADADGAVQDPLKHHEEFWLDDGNIVLVARRVGFRVYRGLLVTQSTVFADMFASSTPNSDETIDSCPVVHLSDSPEDLAHLLRVLLPTTQRRFHREQDTPERTFDEVYAVITLAHKYNIEDVQRQALYSLREYTFNDNFDVWKGTRKEVIQVYGACAIGAVNLARLLDIPQMLPIALYKCLSLGPRMLDGWTRSDGSVEYLSQDDIKRCISALRSLSVERVTCIYSMYAPHASTDCEQPTSCEDALRQMLIDAMENVPESFADGPNVMTPCILNFDDYDLCALCVQDVRDVDVVHRRVVWKTLPQFFGLVVEGWGNGV